MNKISLKVAALVMITSSMGANAVPLLNSGFETGDFSAWDIGAGTNTVSAPGVGAQEGGFAASLIVDENTIDATVRQSFAAAPGDEFYLSGYMLTEEFLPSKTPSFGLLKIIFRDIFGADLVPASTSIGFGDNLAFPGVEAQPFLTFKSEPNSWIFAEAQGVAPDGTAEVQFVLIAVDVGFDARQMWFDNINARKVPEPGTLALLGLGLAGMGFARRRKAA